MKRFVHRYGTWPGQILTTTTGSLDHEGLTFGYYRELELDCDYTFYGIRQFCKLCGKQIIYWSTVDTNLIPGFGLRQSITLCIAYTTSSGCKSHPKLPGGESNPAFARTQNVTGACTNRYTTRDRKSNKFHIILIT